MRTGIIRKTTILALIGLLALTTAAFTTARGSILSDADKASFDAARVANVAALDNCQDILARNSGSQIRREARECITSLNAAIGHIDAGLQAGSVTSTTLPATTTAASATTTTKATTTTTTTSVPSQSTTSTTRPASGSAKPPAGGYFTMTTPGTAFKTEAQCASEVHRSTWEPKPQNTNNNGPTPQPVTLNNSPDFRSAWNTGYKTRINGNFSGTTDEIIQFYACKWGFSDEIVRAQAVNESEWDQDVFGDYEARTRGHCTSEFPSGTTCPTSFGFLQIKWYFHPGQIEGPGGSYPNSRRYTAFNVDYALAEMRGCYDGLSTYLNNPSGDVWGCLGAWFSGAWRDSGALSYISRVQGFYNQKAWLSW